MILINNFRIPRWSELPDVDLYLDQVVKLINSRFVYAAGEDGGNGENSEILTKTMINNYVKNKLIDPPVKKQYSKVQLAKLFVICVLKQVYSMQDIKTLIEIALVNAEIGTAYDKFCSLFEAALKCTYAKKDFIDNNIGSDNMYLLKSVLLSCSYKIYAQNVIASEK